MFQLSKLTSLVKKRKRVGRGGNRGGTSGRGNKGQNARSGGGVGAGFEGGQMPLHRRLPKRGFTNAPFKVPVLIINTLDLENRFNNGDKIDIAMMIERSIIKPKRGGSYRVKVLGDGVLTKKLHVVADAFSSSAKMMIEKVGGSIEFLKHKGE
jgi:large subunit ribosomal protein L15